MVKREIENRECGEFKKQGIIKSYVEKRESPQGDSVKSFSETLNKLPECIKVSRIRKKDIHLVG